MGVALGAASESGLGVGLLAAAVLLGLRHGIDWDHIAAITDIAASQENPRDGLVLGTRYVLGHAAVVFVLGVVAIMTGKSLPDGIDAAMGRVVGWTLVALGLYVTYSLIRDRGRFRMRSRWMLILAVVRRGWGAVRSLLPAGRSVPRGHSHAHAAAPGIHHGAGSGDAAGSVPGQPFTAPLHSHAHDHDEAFPQWSGATSVGIGMLHGVGAETPTQVVVFLAAASAGGTTAGLTVLIAFIAGLVVSNSAITILSAAGFLAADRHRAVYVSLGIATAAVSLLLGGMLVLGRGAALPALFAG